MQPKYITRWQAETPSVEMGPSSPSFTKKPAPYGAGMDEGPTTIYDPFEHTNSDEFPWKLNQ